MKTIIRAVNLLAFFVAIVAINTGSAKAGTDLDDACDILRDRIGWYTAASDVSKKWQISVPTILAVMHQESRFKATAAAKTTSAYGYAQALDGTWGLYQEANNAADAKRTSFVASADFIGWYMGMTKQRVGVPLDDVAGHYLAYHEGHVGYRSMRWKKNKELVAVAHDVARRADAYEEQMRVCKMAPTPTTVAGSDDIRVPLSKPFALAKVTPDVPRRKPIDALVAEAYTSPRNLTW